MDIENLWIQLSEANLHHTKGLVVLREVLNEVQELRRQQLEQRAESEQLALPARDWIDEVQAEMLWRLTRADRRHRFVRDGIVWVPWTPSQAADWEVVRRHGIPSHKLPEVMYREHPKIHWDRMPDPNRPEVTCRWCGITEGAA